MEAALQKELAEIDARFASGEEPQAALERQLGERRAQLIARLGTAEERAAAEESARAAKAARDAEKIARKQASISTK